LIVFASPNFLDLRIVCGPRTPIELTGIWPPLPIIITNEFGLHLPTGRMPGDYDIDASIVHPNRVREIRLFHLTRSSLQRLASVTRMQEQFSALTHLILHYNGQPSSALPDGFLGGSAPLLQSLALYFIPFPALPKLLLSATHLVSLILHYIPHSRYFSPEAIVNTTSRTCSGWNFSTHLPQARWTQNDGSVAYAAEYTFGRAGAIRCFGIYPGRH